MSVRTIESPEISVFSKETPSSASWEIQLRSLLRDGKTRFSWCFVFERNGVFVGRIVYGLMDQDLIVFYLSMDETEDHAMDTLIRESGRIMAERGFPKVTLHLYSDKPSFEWYARTLQRNDFVVVQRKIGFINKSLRANPSKNRLVFRSRKSVGDDGFIEAICQVTRDTLDQNDLDALERYGDQPAAKRLFEVLRQIDDRRDWWQLAYCDRNLFAGLVVPQKIGESTGAINYIGVAPEHRGQGFVSELLEEGIRILREHKVSEIIADIDTGNFPLDKALRAKGFVPDSSMLVMKRTSNE